MRILLADDEPLARSRLRGLLEELGNDCRVVAEASDGLETLRLWEETKPDTVLLDIHMPAMDGLDVARELARVEAPPAVIFTTAYDEHALRAFETGALHYLLKPIRKARLKEALSRAQALHRGRLTDVDRARQIQRCDRRSLICAQMHGELHLIPVADVLYFRAEQKYVAVRTADAEFLIDEPLKALESEFAGDFIRIHRNTLVALGHVERLERATGGRLALSVRGYPMRLEVSRRHGATVRVALRRLKGGCG